MDLEFLKAEYESEWQRRDQLQAAASTPLAVLTVLGGAIVYLVREFRSSPSWMTSGFWMVVALASAAYAVAVYMLVRSYFGYRYRRIPLPSQLVEYEGEVRKYLARQGNVGSITVKSDFEEHLSAAYVAATDRNAVNNINRGHYLHKANAASVVALIFAVAAAVPFAAQQRSPSGQSPTPATRSLTMPEDTNNQQPQTKPAETKPTTPPAERPRFPDNLEVRTGTKEPKKK